MKLNANQIQAITMLASGSTAKAAAELVGVTPQTISEWRKDPVFEARLNELKWDSLYAARESLRCAAQSAADGLRKLATDSVNEEVRRKACMDILALIGLADPSTGMFGWGVGSADPVELKNNQQQANAKKELISALTKASLCS